MSEAFGTVTIHPKAMRMGHVLGCWCVQQRGFGVSRGAPGASMVVRLVGVAVGVACGPRTHASVLVGR